MKEVFVLFSHGYITYIHSDRIAKVMPGKRVAPRVSDVSFDYSKQEWIARLKNGVEIARDKSRDAVIQKEGKEIIRMIAQGEHIPGGVFLPPVYEKKYGISINPKVDMCEICYKGRVRNANLVYDGYLIHRPGYQGDPSKEYAAILICVYNDQIIIKESDSGVKEACEVKYSEPRVVHRMSLPHHYVEELKSRQGVYLPETQTENAIKFDTAEAVS